MKLKNLYTHDKTIISLSIAFFVLIGFNPVEAQTQESPTTNVWINAGFGASSIGSLSGSASLNIKVKRILFTIRTSGHMESMGIFSGGDEFSDLSFLIGYCSSNPTSNLSIAVGLTKVSGSRYVGKPGLFGNGKRLSIESQVGLAVESQLLVKATDAFGVAIVPYVNINSEQTYFCFTFCLIIGKLN